MNLVEKVKSRMRELGISPKRSMGQNFLIDEGVISKVVQCTSLTDSSNLLEIGPGLGALTDRLIELGRPLTLMEFDCVLAEYWRSQGQRVIESDALKYNWGELRSGSFTLVSNLPYQISSRLVIDLSTSAMNIRDMVLMFQKEVAQRISARPRTKNYGFLSIIAQSFWYVDRVVDISPKSFYPMPNVASRVLVFKRLDVGYDSEFVDFVKCSFAKRRKMLAKNLLSMKVLNMMELVKILEDIGLGAKVRAEELSPSQFVELFKKVYGR